MTPDRQRELECTGAALTQAEWREGYHRCWEFDGLVTLGEVFQDEEERVCLCGFDKRNIDLYNAESAVRDLTVQIVDEALTQMFGEKI